MRRETYNSDSFEPVTNPPADPNGDQLARMRSNVSLYNLRAHAVFQLRFEYVKLLENFYLYLILLYSTRKVFTDLMMS
jgi:hypothetical protein